MYSYSNSDGHYVPPVFSFLYNPIIYIIPLHIIFHLFMFYMRRWWWDYVYLFPSLQDVHTIRCVPLHKCLRTTHAGSGTFVFIRPVTRVISFRSTVWLAEWRSWSMFLRSRLFTAIAVIGLNIHQTRKHLYVFPVK